MEFTAPQAGDMDVFRELREDFEIGLGCVDVTPGQRGLRRNHRRPRAQGAEVPRAANASR